MFNKRLKVLEVFSICSLINDDDDGECIRSVINVNLVKRRVDEKGAARCNSSMYYNEKEKRPKVDQRGRFSAVCVLEQKNGVNFMVSVVKWCSVTFT